MAVKEIKGPKKQNGSKNNKAKHKIGLGIAGLHFLVLVVFLVFLAIMNVLDMKLLLVIGGALTLLWLAAFLCQFSDKMHIPGKILSILLCAVMGFGIVAMAQVNSTLGNMTNNEYKVDKMVVIVKADDSAEKIEDALSYTFGRQNTDVGTEGEKAGKAQEQIESDHGVDLQVKVYDSVDGVVQALYDGDVQAIIMNEAMRNTIEEHFEDFSEDTKILHEVIFKTKVEKTEKKTGDVTKDTFNVYISGIDVYGDISTNSRSDVNIIATINPTTKQVLLTTTPRDYYVEIPGVSSGRKDKLTHAGIYGVDCSMETLEEIYGGIDIDYYVRLNFSGLEKIIDAIGGVTVYSEYSFTSFGHSFTKGENYMDGETALAFARNRKNVPGGERQRGKNQQQVIKGIIRKITSPSVLANYASILDAVSSCVQTNLSDAQMKSLVKMQLKDNASWNVISLAANGTGGRDYCYSYTGKSLYVMYPDSSTIDYIKGVMNKVHDGETLTEADENGLD